ncbi:MAG: pilus assembly protein PilP [Gammaproteobacteria bacterium]|nr:MAG: pilus assembly protein PilP [Gammaproteobacteria bacterium]
MALQDTLEQLQSFDFNDLDLNNIGTWPTPIKLILMLVVFSLVLGGGYYYYLTDKQTVLEQAETKEQSLKNDYEKKSAQAANLEAYREQKIQMENTFGALVKQLPSETEVPGLLEDITRTAIDNDLTIESIDLGTERVTEFYAELPIDITVEGDYHKIGSFVSGVANLSRIVTLHDFNISPAGSVQNLKMNIRAKTYRYLDDEEG